MSNKRVDIFRFCRHIGRTHRLEQLCRTITRPALANERVPINKAGQVVLKPKTAWPGGTTHIVMAPLGFGACCLLKYNDQTVPSTVSRSCT